MRRSSVVKNGAALAAAFRKNGMPVFLVRVAFSPDGKDVLRPLVDTPMAGANPAARLDGHCSGNGTGTG